MSLKFESHDHTPTAFYRNQHSIEIVLNSKLTEYTLGNKVIGSALQHYVYMVTKVLCIPYVRLTTAFNINVPKLLCTKPDISKRLNANCEW